jgi:hypothetical protein
MSHVNKAALLTGLTGNGQLIEVGEVAYPKLMMIKF